MDRGQGLTRQADDELHDAVVAVTLLPTAYLYLVVVKWSRFGTLGYRLFHARVVDVTGQQPGLGALTLRFLFAVAGPIDIVLDMFWIPSVFLTTRPMVPA